MKAALRNGIGEAFTLGDGPQVLPTCIPASEPAPGRVGDTIVIRSKSGRIESSRISALEFILLAGGGELHAILLEQPVIPDFGDFSDGSFEVTPADE